MAMYGFHYTFEFFKVKGFEEYLRFGLRLFFSMLAVFTTTERAVKKVTPPLQSDVIDLAQTQSSTSATSLIFPVSTVEVAQLRNNLNSQFLQTSGVISDTYMKSVLS